MQRGHDTPGRAARLLGEVVARAYLRRPELAEPIALRYRSLRSLIGGVLNELAYRLGWSRSPFFLSANLELTNRCNLRCAFCPTGNGRMTRRRATLDAALFRKVIRESRPLEHALLFQWGEPLLHPAFDELAREAGRAGIRTFLTTNGTLLDDSRIQRLLDAKIDRITVSVDGDARTHEHVRGVPLSRVEAGLRRLIRARDAARSSTAIDVSMVVAPETETAVGAFEDRFRKLADRVQRIPVLTSGVRRTRCREPWRGGLVVLADGRVTACCVDHDGVLAVGDARRDSLRDIWNGDRMQGLRRAHAGRGELPSICRTCTEYPTDAAAPRFSSPEEASRQVPPSPESHTRSA